MRHARSDGLAQEGTQTLLGGLAAAYLGISRSMLRKHGPSQKHIGRCAVWDWRDLDRWADALGTATTDPQPLDRHTREAESESVADRVRRRLANGAN